MPAIWTELVLAHFQRLQARNAAQDFGSVSPAQSAFHYYNSLVTPRTYDLLRQYYNWVTLGVEKLTIKFFDLVIGESEAKQGRRRVGRFV
ncbi:hypothetical protein J6590_023536 [Homalodisca vitripennis]|nr:hypothetical protein J6590_023536 [Homalodisca vitripennis]